MSTATMDGDGAAEHHEEAGKAREAFRGVTRDVAWVAEAPKPHKAWLGALGISVTMLAIGCPEKLDASVDGISTRNRSGNATRTCLAVAMPDRRGRGIKVASTRGKATSQTSTRPQWSPSGANV